MKSIVTSLLVLISVAASAQTLTADQLAKSTSRPKGPFKEYVSRSGEVFRVGEMLPLGTPSAGGAYLYIEEAPSRGDGQVRRLRHSPALKEIQIQYIRVDYSGRWDHYLQLKCSGTNDKVHYLVNLEQALQQREIATGHIAEDEALATLRKAKEKLDLQLITQQQYDSLKTALSKYIK